MSFSPALLPSVRRRNLLKTFLYGASASSLPWLAGCGSSDDATTSAGGRVGASETNRFGGSALSNNQFRFRNIGPLGEPDANGVRTAAGFSTRVVAINSLPPAPGATPWHIFNDGGGVVPREDGGWIYCSNSEVPGVGTIGFQVPQLAPLTNPLEALVPGLGGASALVFGPDGTIEDSYRILRNTTFNCAGVVTPWKTWLSCEEIPTGLVWECDPFGIQAARPLPALGVFSHEAVAIDSERRVFYMTEDMPDGRFYRWVPTAGDWPEDAERANMNQGLLQILKVEGDLADALNGPVRYSWVNAANPNAPQMENRLPETAVFDGGEGVWYQNDRVFFTTKGDERLWMLNTTNQTIEVAYDLSTAKAPNNILSGVDNITMTPFGEVLVAEDGGDMQVVVVYPDGVLVPLLQIVGQDQSEIAGIAFSPDGKRMYFTSDRGGPNLQGGFGLGLGMLYELMIPDTLPNA
ncbi:alkaline phosphatase PhoX [Limnobacter alexandrii]|uniref:alkaline phosphatase PhoX n=1 Tax=Limnobacter alexandrii TaxID=2570352 RepID=UPI001FE3F7A9|nr:alkaline phosphatase PhoX [Limnobacter alexandrii]